MIWKILRILGMAYLTTNSYGFQSPPQQRLTVPGFQSDINPNSYHNNRKSVIPKCPYCEEVQYFNPQPPPPPTPISLVPGVSLGIPLNILTWLYTTYQHHENIMTPQIIILNCLVGTYTYGMDRMIDALEFDKISSCCVKKSKSKRVLYQYILENYDILKNIYNSIYWMFTMILMADPVNGIRIQTLLFLVIYELAKFSMNLRYTFFSYYLGIQGYKLYTIYAIITAIMINSHLFDTEFFYLPFLIALDTTKYYPELKRRIGWLKSPYVASMWTGVIAILPNVIHEHNYQVLMDSTILVPFFGMMGLSNIADLKDIDEDRENGVKTIPVLFGVNTAILASFLSLCFAYLYR